MSSHSSHTTHHSSLITHHFPIVLASGSAIRAQMMKAAGLHFSVAPSNVDEEAIKRAWLTARNTSEHSHELAKANDPIDRSCKERRFVEEDLAAELARAKALNVAPDYPDHLTIGADQLCVLSDQYPPLNLPPKGGESERSEQWGVPKAASERITRFARELRQNLTNAERLLWSALRNKQLEGFRFRRQMPVENHIVDFACLSPKLIIELDGGQHSESDGDISRDAFLRAQGFIVLRFWNHEVMDNLEGVLLTILANLQGTPISISSLRGQQGEIFDKPGTPQQAERQLAALSGETHRQISAVCIVRGQEVLWEYQECAELTMRPLTEAEIRAYIHADQPLKSCGSYKYESLGRHLFARVRGTDDAIKGLPLQALIAQLHAMQAISL